MQHLSPLEVIDTAPSGLTRRCAGLGVVARNFSNGPGESFAKRPIRMMVPQPAGGTMDSNGRALASYLEQALGRDIVIANIKPE